MALEPFASNDLLNCIIYDTISATPYSCFHGSTSETSVSLENNLIPQCIINGGAMSSVMQQSRCPGQEVAAADHRQQKLAVQLGRKKRRRRRQPRVCKNKEEAEKQRLEHIVVERNRRRQMNDHLAVLRSLMPESYVQRGDQATIVGGAIEFVKELEHLLQSLESQKVQMLQKSEPIDIDSTSTTTGKLPSPPFAQFFTYPQYTWCQIPNKFASNSEEAIADIQVTLIETHANLRILSRKNPRQLAKIVSGFHTLCLTILHLNVTTMDPLVLYSISAKVEEGCQITSVDDIAGAVHHMLKIIEDEAVLG